MVNWITISKDYTEALTGEKIRQCKILINPIPSPRWRFWGRRFYLFLVVFFLLFVVDVYVVVIIFVVLDVGNVISMLFCVMLDADFANVAEYEGKLQNCAL